MSSFNMDTASLAADSLLAAISGTPSDQTGHRGGSEGGSEVAHGEKKKAGEEFQGRVQEGGMYTTVGETVHERGGDLSTTG